MPPPSNPYQGAPRPFAPQNPANFNPSSTNMVGYSPQGYTAGPSFPPDYGQPGRASNSYVSNMGTYQPRYMQPYNPDRYYGGSMRPTNQGINYGRRNVPGGPTDMPPPPGFEGFDMTVYDPNRPNLQFMPGGRRNIQDQFWRGY